MARRLIYLIPLVIALLCLPYQALIGPVSQLYQRWTGVDGVSSASVAGDNPSGEYVMLLNAARHQARGTVGQWESFLMGESVLIMEDITCMAATQDPTGMEVASNYQARLPENQMKLSYVDGILMLSKADVGQFDLIVMSKSFAESFSAQTVLAGSDVRWLEVAVPEGGDAS